MSDTPKRLTLSAILEMMLARSGAQHSSVTLACNAKGETTIEVQVKVGDEGVPNVAAAEVRATHVYDSLRGLYPSRVGNGNEPATVSLTRNAKGETQVDVKASTEVEAVESYERLRARYPLASGAVSA